MCVSVGVYVCEHMCESEWKRSCGFDRVCVTECYECERVDWKVSESVGVR